MTLLQRELKERYVYMSKRLPDEYQEVEYIESSGTQYIDTGCTFAPEQIIDLKIMRLNSNDWLYFGSNSSGKESLIMYKGNSSEPYRNYFGGQYDYTFNINTDYHIIMDYKNTTNNMKLSINNIVVKDASTSDDGANNQKIYLFGGIKTSSNTSIDYYYSSRIYSVKITDASGNIIRDFIPCYRKSDNEIGLYDLVNNQFYTNQGTGTFTKGNDQNTPGLRNVTEVYVGNGDSTATKIRPVWKPGTNTLIYLPLETDVTDTTGNYTITNSNVIFNDGYAVFNGTSSKLVTTANYGLTGNAAFTFSFWIYHNRNLVDVIFGKGPTSGTSNWVGCFINNNSLTIWRYGSGDINIGATISLNTRTHIVMTSDGTTTKIYQNGTLAYSDNITYSIDNGNLGIGANFRDNANYYGGNISKFIGENKARTAQEVSDYYNSTKTLYGIS